VVALIRARIENGLSSWFRFVLPGADRMPWQDRPREGPSRNEPPVGSRVKYGHDSRYRFEGSRVACELLSDKVIAPLTE